ncbi:class I SAM-dependent methyltransferase [Polynucleobacter sp. 71A-WALBACH]|uniref:class I SAM-dependent methyltransferase n=1 Tax=Polynucleobacter sp. 71A-WALBACH TaxID=2689097 RepID=UPI001C0E6D52|nr:class I SAM-dependent methyltransferase [Polynucleobacter sp. 71A-WALBACH]MBU3593278.1 class I SAM-dependent methyltransferase [Polynucleobacter sp. 71A-WALBACH]
MSSNLRYTMIDGIKCYSPEVARAYTDYPDGGFDLTNENVGSSFWVSSRNRLFKRIVESHLVVGGKTRFLDIGCGTGDFIRQISPNSGLEITGSEIYLKGLSYAKKSQPDVDFIQFDVTQGVIKEQNFDMITAFDVIEHIENDNKALSNISQMMNQSGVLVISVPQHMFLWSKLDEIVKHKRRYSRRDLVGKIEASGFTVKYVTSFLFILFPLMLVSRLLDRRGNKSLEDKEGLEKRVKFSGLLNCIFDCFMRVDEVLIRLGFSLPFGGTLILVARKN